MQEVIVFRIDAQLHFLPLFLGNQPLLAEYVIKIIKPKLFGHLQSQLLGS